MCLLWRKKVNENWRWVSRLKFGGSFLTPLTCRFHLLLYLLDIEFVKVQVCWWRTWVCCIFAFKHVDDVLCEIQCEQRSWICLKDTIVTRQTFHSFIVNFHETANLSIPPLQSRKQRQSATDELKCVTTIYEQIQELDYQSASVRVRRKLYRSLRFVSADFMHLPAESGGWHKGVTSIRDPLAAICHFKPRAGPIASS